MADKYNKVEPKLSTGIIVSIVATIVVILTLVLVALPSNSEKIYAAYMMTADTEYFTEAHPFYQVNDKKVARSIENDETFLLMISSPDCEPCQAHIGPFQRYYESTGMNEVLDQIYYVSSIDNPVGVANLAEQYEDIDESTPQLLLVVDGEIVLVFDPSASTTDQLRNTNVRTFFEDAIAAMNGDE